MNYFEKIGHYEAFIFKNRHLLICKVVICSHFMFQNGKKVRITHLFAKDANSCQKCSDSDNHSSIQSVAFNVY